MKIWAQVLHFYLLSFCGSKAMILDGDQTVEMLLKGKSLIRLGDGEFGIRHGYDIHYQKWSLRLKEAFDTISNDYFSDGDCRYLLAVPRKFFKCSGFKLLKKREYISSWARARWDFSKMYPQKDCVYGDAFLFHKGNSEVYQRIWTENSRKKIFFVHNDCKYAENFEKSYSIEALEFVRCPQENAFSSIEEIENKIINIAGDLMWDPKEVLILVSAGPAGKVIVFDLSKIGYQCIDTGHCWDDPLDELR